MDFGKERRKRRRRKGRGIPALRAFSSAFKTRLCHDRVWFSLLSKISETFLSSTVESCAVILQTRAFPSGVSPAGVTDLGRGSTSDKEHRGSLPLGPPRVTPHLSSLLRQCPPWASCLCVWWGWAGKGGFKSDFIS